MQINHPNPAKRIYRVDLGHSHVLVESHSPEEAIRAARAKFSLDMPRLWDVIQKLTDDKFQVSMVY
jgi:hypothetical protein